MGLCNKILDDTSWLIERTLVMLLDFCQNNENEEYHKVQKQEGHRENQEKCCCLNFATRGNKWSDDTTPYFFH